MDALVVETEALRLYPWSAPLTRETFDYALLAYEYGGAAVYERYLELLAEAIENGSSSAIEE